MRELRAKGLSLVEVMIVMAIVALSVGLVGPRIGAGMTRLEVHQVEQTIRSFVQIARSKARRTDQAHFVVVDRGSSNLVLVGPDMQVLRERDLPSSIEVISDSDSGDTLIYVPPSGLLRQESISLRSRLGISEVTFE
jgi:prepilin-type N-terminal cleavage/methylation domain-containing protein